MQHSVETLTGVAAAAVALGAWDDDALLDEEL